MKTKTVAVGLFISLIATLAYFGFTNTRTFPLDSPLYSPWHMYQVPPSVGSQYPEWQRWDKSLEQVAAQTNKQLPLTTTSQWSVYSLAQADAHAPLYRPEGGDEE
jgi:hypothetical protein